VQRQAGVHGLRVVGEPVGQLGRDATHPVQLALGATTGAVAHHLQHHGVLGAVAVAGREARGAHPGVLLAEVIDGVLDQGLPVAQQRGVVRLLDQGQQFHERFMGVVHDGHGQGQGIGPDEGGHGGLLKMRRKADDDERYVSG